MSDAAVFLLLPDGMADWEPGFAVAGLRHWAKVPVRTVGFTRDPITTMGGLRILPDMEHTLNTWTPANFAAILTSVEEFLEGPCGMAVQ